MTKRYRIGVGGHTYEVEVEDVRSRPVVARIGDETFLVAVEPLVTGERGAPVPAESNSVGGPTPSTPTRATPPLAASAGPQSLPAPIPGVVVSVTVVAGQTIERGDTLLTIEAMKMFNVIRSPRAGRIATVHVTERAQVSQGDPLVTFDS